MALTELPAFFNMKLCDKDGNLTQDGMSYFDQQFQTLNLLLNTFNQFLNTTLNKGNVDINYISLGGLEDAKVTDPSFISDTPVGSMWYNKGTNKLQFLSVDINGVKSVQTITSV